MDYLTGIKGYIFVGAGVLGTCIANLLGGWDTALQTLLIFMAIDFVTGLIVAGVFKASKKSSCGALESGAAAKGIARKGMALLVVLVCAQLDLMYGGTYIRDGAIIAYVLVETVSIIENAGLMGVPIPDVVTKAIDVLKKKGDEPK